MELVERFDFAKIGKNIKKTPQGFLRIPAYFTRAGIFNYKTHDGKTIREYRPPEEVFNKDSLDTIAGAPVVDLHPERDGKNILVDPNNIKETFIGRSGDQVKREGDFVAGDVVIMDQKAIDMIERGDRKEISLGYKCAIDFTPGEINGQKYDCVQRNIIANHIALGPKNWNRAGSEVSLRLDSNSAYLTDIHHMGEPIMDKMTFRLDGKDISLEKEGAEIVQKALAERDAKIANMQTRLDELKATLDDQKNHTKQLEQKLQDESHSLAQLMQKAMGVLGTDADFAGKSKNDIMKSVIQKLAPTATVEGDDQSYVRGMFDALMKSREEKPQDEMDVATMQTSQPQTHATADSKYAIRADSLAVANAIVLSAKTNGGAHDIRADARRNMIEYKENAWKEKFAVTKQFN